MTRRVCAGTCGDFRKPGNDGRIPRHLCRIRIPLPENDPGALRVELLRMLRTHAPALACHRADSQSEASVGLPSTDKEKMAQQLED